MCMQKKFIGKILITVGRIIIGLVVVVNLIALSPSTFVYVFVVECLVCRYVFRGRGH